MHLPTEPENNNNSDTTDRESDNNFEGIPGAMILEEGELNVWRQRPKQRTKNIVYIRVKQVNFNDFDGVIAALNTSGTHWRLVMAKQVMEDFPNIPINITIPSSDSMMRHYRELMAKDILLASDVWLISRRRNITLRNYGNFSSGCDLSVVSFCQFSTVTDGCTKPPSSTEWYYNLRGAVYKLHYFL
ncbi:hypothetical protein E1301_Tti018154 [Triplophysa tibetana]|uniref:Uncharacterized protein n=1 Tax=Triplophysa tibetana TaxID=1572043 RepID=A0A5A9PJW0_9TELE|nr:hypothetical protein E1301_Tti018154 [Triplophysa tibetana]